MVATPLDELRRSKDSSMRFQPVDQAERKQYSQHAQNVQRFREERQKLETNAAGAPAETRTKDVAPARVKLPGSPIVGKPAADFGKGRAVPKTYDAPKLDTKVEPKPRAARSLEQPQQRTVKRMPLDQPQTQHQPTPKVERAAPQPQPKVERAAPQPQPKVERAALQPRDHGQADAPSAGSKQEKNQDKGKGKGKN